ncbi:MAG: hypothetical protein ACYC6P_14730 [Ignavibacteriaceae bacterium]
MTTICGSMGFLPSVEVTLICMYRGFLLPPVVEMTFVFSIVISKELAYRQGRNDSYLDSVLYP